MGEPFRDDEIEDRRTKRVKHRLCHTLSTSTQRAKCQQ
jgi:hypothetical protein